MYRDNPSVRAFTVRETKNLHRVCKVDQFASKAFNNNDFGWTTNSISAMARASSYQEFLMLAQSIAQQPAKYNLPDKCTFKDAMALCRPRFAQNPCELNDFIEGLADMDMRKMDEAYVNALKDIKFDKPVEPSQNPVPDEK